jgi:spore germination protein GerM
VVDTGIGKRIAIVSTIVIVVLVVLILAWRVGWLRRERVVPTEVQRVPEETRSVSLYFASRDADRLLPETREIAVEEGLERQIEAIVSALLEGPTGKDKVNAVPPGTRVLHVFWEEDTQTAFLDFSRTLVSNHPGGSTGEYFTIGMIVRTVSANFPQVRRLQFLVDGYPVETIAGHYAVDQPIDVLRWR